MLFLVTFPFSWKVDNLKLRQHLVVMHSMVANTKRRQNKIRGMARLYSESEILLGLLPAPGKIAAFTVTSDSPHKHDEIEWIEWAWETPKWHYFFGMMIHPAAVAVALWGSFSITWHFNRCLFAWCGTTKLNHLRDASKYDPCQWQVVI